MSGGVPSRRDRIAALALLAVAILAGGGMVAAHVAEVEQAHAARVAALDNERRVLARLIATDAMPVSAAEGPARGLIEADEPPLAAAQAQGLLAQAVQANGAMLMTTQSLEPETADDLLRLPVQLAFQADIAQLVAIVGAVEGSRTLLVIDRVAVTDPDGSLPGAARPPGPNFLRVEMTVSAYWRAP